MTEPPTSWSRQDARVGAVLIFLCACASTAIVYSNAQSYSPAHALQTGYTDSRDYLAMAQGQSVGGKRGHRLLVPWLAAHVPGLPRSMFSPGAPVQNRDWARRFAVVNAAFLLGTCVCLLGIARSIHFNWTQTASMLAMFLSAPPVVIAAGLPMTDAAFWFFLAAALLAILHQRPIVYFAVLAVGVLAKELVLLAVPFIFLLRMPARTRAAFVLASLPAAVIAMALRPAIGPFALPDVGAAWTIRNVVSQLRHLVTLDGMVDIGLAFGLAWIPAVAAWRRPLPPVVRRLALLFPIVVAGELLFGSRNVPRNFFAAFPGVLAVAAVAIDRWVGEGAAVTDDPTTGGTRPV